MRTASHLSALVLGWAAAVAGAGSAAGELPANTWVKVDDGGGGVRRGSAVVWLQKQGGFLVLGGARGNKKFRIDRPYEIQISPS